MTCDLQIEDLLLTSDCDSEYEKTAQANFSESVNQSEELDPHSYDRYVVAFSGGKDGLASVLHLLEIGVHRSAIELHHHRVDGNESSLMDWPVTESYCEAIAKALDIDLTFSWRVGGIEGELNRDGTSTAAVVIPWEDGGYKSFGGEGPPGTRLRFPQVSADLRTRWCSPAAKIDVFSRYLNNHPKFTSGRTLVLTGERAEESPNRAKYKQFEAHRCDLRNGRKIRRHIDAWRAVHSWSEKQVWELIAKYRLCAHPCYYLGYSRASCRQCIFGNKDQWATNRAIAPSQFEKIAWYEKRSQLTIHRTKSVIELADEGTPYDCDPFWVELANSKTFDRSAFMDPWVLPAGAFGDSCGPT